MILEHIMRSWWKLHLLIPVFQHLVATSYFPAFGPSFPVFRTHAHIWELYLPAFWGVYCLLHSLAQTVMSICQKNRKLIFQINIVTKNVYNNSVFFFCDRRTLGCWFMYVSNRLQSLETAFSSPQETGWTQLSTIRGKWKTHAVFK